MDKYIVICSNSFVFETFLNIRWLQHTNVYPFFPQPGLPWGSYNSEKEIGQGGSGEPVPQHGGTGSPTVSYDIK